MTLAIARNRSSCSKTCRPIIHLRRCLKNVHEVEGRENNKYTSGGGSTALAVLMPSQSSTTLSRLHRRKLSILLHFSEVTFFKTLTAYTLYILYA